MQLTVDRIGQVALVTIPGPNLDAGNAESFKLVTESMMGQGGHIVLDMSELEFVDSSGLGALLSCLRRFSHFGGELRLCGLTKPVRVLFELVRMHRVFEICNDRAEALRACQGGGESATAAA